jgi:hypothetical protein
VLGREGVKRQLRPIVERLIARHQARNFQNQKRTRYKSLALTDLLHWFMNAILS